MKNLSKNTKTLIYSAAGLAVLIAVALVLVLTRSPLEPEEPAHEEDSPAVIVLTEFTAEDVVRISIKNPLDEYVIEPALGIAELLGAPRHEERFDAAVRYVSRFRAIAVVEEDAADLEQYGLGGDAAWFRAEFVNGESLEIYIGDPTPTTQPMSYIRIAGSNTVYTAWSYFVNNFREDRRFYVSLTLTEEHEAVGMPLVDRMVINHDGGETFVIERIPELEEGGIATSLNIHRMIQPYQIELSFSASQPLLNGLFGLTAERAAYVGESDDEVTGLDMPIATVEMTVAGKTSLFKIGNPFFERDDEDESRFVGFYGVYSEVPDVVYVFGPLSLPWLSFDIEQIMATLFHLPSITGLSDFIVEIFATGRNLHFEITGDAGEEEFVLNGEQAESRTFRNLYQYCISAPADALFDGDEGIINALRDGELPLMARFTYRYRGESRADDVIEFYDSADRRTLIVKNGEPLFSSRIMYVTRLEQNVEAYLNGESLIMNW